jgi:hypothetical protein
MCCGRLTLPDLESGAPTVNRCEGVQLPPLPFAHGIARFYNPIRYLVGRHQTAMRVIQIHNRQVILLFLRAKTLVKCCECGEDISPEHVQWVSVAKEPDLNIRALNCNNHNCINYKDRALLVVLNDGNTIKYEDLHPLIDRKQLEDRNIKFEV